MAIEWKYCLTLIAVSGLRLIEWRLIVQNMAEANPLEVQGHVKGTFTCDRPGKISIYYVNHAS